MIGRHLVVLVTFPSKEEAYKVVKKLVEEGLAACVNVVDKVRSFFIFEGKFEECDEALAIIKTKLEALQKLIEVIKSIHSYSVPEIIAMPIIAGYEHYLKWLEESVKV